MTNTITNAQIDAILDSPGSFDYVIADKRQRLHLFARRVLELRSAAEADLMPDDILDFAHRMQDWHAGRMRDARQIQTEVKEDTTLHLIGLSSAEEDFKLTAHEAQVFRLGMEAGMGCFDKLPFRLDVCVGDGDEGEEV